MPRSKELRTSSTEHSEVTLAAPSSSSSATWRSQSASDRTTRSRLVALMGPDDLESFERRTVAAWDRALLGDPRRAIERRRRNSPGESQYARVLLRAVARAPE